MATYNSKIPFFSIPQLLSFLKFRVNKHLTKQIFSFFLEGNLRKLKLKRKLYFLCMRNMKIVTIQRKNYARTWRTLVRPKKVNFEKCCAASLCFLVYTRGMHRSEASFGKITFYVVTFTLRALNWYTFFLTITRNDLHKWCICRWRKQHIFHIYNEDYNERKTWESKIILTSNKLEKCKIIL